MANVTAPLNKILSAIYGKDVRKAIYDAIAAINTQVETTTSQEAARSAAESQRAQEETNRNTAEGLRTLSETARQTAEDERKKTIERAQNDFQYFMQESESQLDEMQQKIQQAIDGMTSTGVMLDETLSKSGFAADAKATGEAIASLRAPVRKKEDLIELSEGVSLEETSCVFSDGHMASLIMAATISLAGTPPTLISLCVSPIHPWMDTLGVFVDIHTQKSYPVILSESGDVLLVLPDPSQSSTNPQEPLCIWGNILFLPADP